MTRTMSLGGASQIAQLFMTTWQAEKDNIKLSAKGMYSLLNIRNTCIDKFKAVQESAMEFARSVGATETDKGLQVPEDKIPEVDRQLNDLQMETFELEYTPIAMRDDDALPMDYMEILLPFIEMK